MRESRPHGFVAWLFDWYIVSFFVGGAVAFYLALLGKRGSFELSLVIVAVVLLSTIIYHRVIAKRVAMLSPGEQIAGRYYEIDRKVWRNPYRVSRWPLFGFMLIIAIYAGNTWDSIGRGESFDVLAVLVRLLALAGLTFSFVLVGRGIVWGMAGLALYATSQALGMYLQPVPPEVTSAFHSSFIGFLLGYALLAVAFWIGYSRVNTSLSNKSV